MAEADAITDEVAGGSVKSLPEGWVLPTVGSLVNVNYGKGLTKSNRRSGDVPVYGSNGVVGGHDRSYTKGPSIVIGRKGTVGTVHLSTQPCWPIDTTYFIDEFHHLSPQFLTYGLQYLNLSEHDTSTAIPGLNRDDLYRQLVPLPPLAEQKRIVAKVEELLAHVGAAHEHLDKVPKILKAFRQSVLGAACSGRLTEDWRKTHPDTEPSEKLLARILVQRKTRISKEPRRPEGEGVTDLPNSWCCATVDQLLFEPLANGRSVVDRKGGFPVLRLTALKNGRIDLRERKEGAWTESDARKFVVKRGDFLVSRGNGSLALVGRGGLVDTQPDPVAYPDTLIRIRTSESLDSLYLSYVWDSQMMRDQIESKAHTTAGIHKISQKDIAGFVVPLPPFDEQREIVRRVEALSPLADTIQRRVAAAAKRAEKLSQSILAKAFRGELVPTEAELARREGREYEPASALLERIRREREAQEGPRTRRGRQGRRARQIALQGT